MTDEAQHIKNRTTKAAKAAVALKAKYRWCLTGTPIQNNVEELFSLFQFLRAKPLDDWATFKERISSLVKEGKTKLAMKRLHVGGDIDASLMTDCAQSYHASQDEGCRYR